MNAEREEISEELAEAVALAEAGDELTAEEFSMLEEMEDGPDLSDYVQVNDGAYLPSSDTCHCAHCEETFRDTEDFNDVNVSRSWRGGRSENWCESCTNDDAFYCEWRSEYYSAEAFTSVSVDYDTVCLEANEDSIYYWESDGEYHSEPEPEEEDEYGIPDYHSRERNWSIPHGSAFTLGVELETYCPDATAAYEARPAGMIGERDGSLDSYHGVEFVGPPMTFDDYRNGVMWRGHLDTLRKLGASSWSTPDESSQYGMHISVGRQNLDNAHAARFCLFININQALSEKVAGRSANGWAGYGLKDMADIEPRVSGFRGCDKYNATNICRERIEVRIFRGTLAEHGFMRNVEYVQSVLEYTAQTSAIGADDMALYLLWLVDNAARFPNLCAKLEAASYIRLPALLAA